MYNNANVYIKALGLEKTDHVTIIPKYLVYFHFYTKSLQRPNKSRRTATKKYLDDYCTVCYCIIIS